MAAVRSATQYAAQLRALLPSGPAWDPELVPEVNQVIKGLSIELARIDTRAFDLLTEMDPFGTSELVPDWERVMNLPDPCLGLNPSFEDRRLSVRQRLVAVGGQRPAFYVDIAIGQGYPDAEVIEYRAPRMGRSRFGRAHFGTWSMQFLWELKLGGRKRLGRRFGASYWGERFGVNPGSAIECLIHRAAPAHTDVRINYD